MSLEPQEGSGCARTGGCGHGEAGGEYYKWGILWDWFGEHIRLSPVGPVSEVGAKNRGAGSH